jgi:hypothetical protein
MPPKKHTSSQKLISQNQMTPAAVSRFPLSTSRPLIIHATHQKEIIIIILPLSKPFKLPPKKQEKSNMDPDPHELGSAQQDLITGLSERSSAVRLHKPKECNQR